MPNDPPENQSNKNPIPASPASPNRGEPTGRPPAFGSNFNPHVNPPDPNNPYQQSFNPPPKLQHLEHPNHPDLHRKRDTLGRFVLEHPSQNHPTQSSYPPIISTKPSERDTKGDYPPLVQVANPVTYLKIWWKKIMANEGIDLGFRFRIKPLMALMIIAFLISNGLTAAATFSIVKMLFPNSSPILHRQIVKQGIIQQSDQMFYLYSSDSTAWNLKPKVNNINLVDLVGKQVMVTGNLTKEKNLIEVSEVIVTESATTFTAASPVPQNQTNSQLIPNQDLLPKLYPGLIWEKTDRKVLIFTSGKRRIEQEGVYLESAQMQNFPQDFINYYTTQLTDKNFKETLNSKDPDGITITYSKDDLYLTFGTKNATKGSGNSFQIVGYKAYLEHN